MEGHSEVDSIGILIRRIAELIDPGLTVSTPKPYRASRDSLLKNASGELQRALSLTHAQRSHPGGVLVLIDSEGKCPVALRDQLTSEMGSHPAASTTEIACAHQEFETWFLWSATSLAGVGELPVGLTPPQDPDSVQGAKEWLSAQMASNRRYIATVHQPRFTAKFDLMQARERSRSFQKLFQSIERLIQRGLQGSSATSGRA